MAGIGFALQQLNKRDDILGPVASIAHAAVVAAGPWLYTVFALLLIAEAARPAVGAEGIATFRVLVIYVFSLSMIGSSPVLIVATRVLSDSVFVRDYSAVRGLFVSAVTISSLVCICVCSLTFVFVVDAPVRVSVAATIATQAISQVWLSLAFCSALRDYLQVTLAFVIGLFSGVLISVFSAFYYTTPEAMLYGFGAGFTITFVWLTARLLSTFPAAEPDVLRPILQLGRQLLRHRWLALGGLASTIGVWADKWIIWGGAAGERVDAGLLHAPLYDSPLFLANLTIIPSLALFVTTLETGFFDRYSRYLAAIQQHATLAQIRSSRVILERETLISLGDLACIQASICTILALVAPGIISEIGLQFGQIFIFRIALFGCFFQFCFVACSTLVLFFDRPVVYALLQVMYVTLVSVCTAVCSSMQGNYIGLGFFIGSTTSGVAALLVLIGTLRNADYIVFVGSAVRSNNKV